MEIDVNLRKPTASNGLELKTISGGIGYNTSTTTGSNPPVNGVGIGVGHNNLLSHLHNNNNNNNNNNSSHNHRVQNQALHGAADDAEEREAEAEDNEEIDNRLRCLAAVTSQTTTTNTPPIGCCGILTRLLCTSSHTRGKTATSSGDYNTYNNCGPIVHSSLPNGNASGLSGNALATSASATANYEHQQTYMNLWKKNQKTHRRTPQEIYFESRGKSCKKLLKFNGNSNKILLYPEEGWARTASSSYWTITPCWWQPNRCRIEEFAGTQRQVTKAKMLPLEQKGSLLIVGHFRSKNSTAASSSSSSTSSAASSASATSSACHHANGYSSSSAAAPAVTARGATSAASTNTTTSSTTTLCSPLSSFASSASSKDNDEFKLYLSSNISMEDYNMGYCLTGFVERRCQQTNTFQMTHFAVIKRQWPSLAQNNKSTKTTTTQNNSSSRSTSCIGSS